MSLLALLAALVLGWSPFVAISLVVLGALYATQLRIDDAPLEGSAAVVAAGFVVTAELGYWSLEERERIETERGESLRRLAFVAVLGLASALVAEVLLVLAGGVHTSGIGSDLAGAAAATSVLVLIALLARSRARDA